MRREEWNGPRGLLFVLARHYDLTFRRSITSPSAAFSWMLAQSSAMKMLVSPTTFLDKAYWQVGMGF